MWQPLDQPPPILGDFGLLVAPNDDEICRYALVHSLIVFRIGHRLANMSDLEDKRVEREGNDTRRSCGGGGDSALVAAVAATAGFIKIKFKS